MGQGRTFAAEKGKGRLCRISEEGIPANTGKMAHHTAPSLESI